MQISLCLTNYNRFALLLKSFEQVLNDDRISEIIISDDNSEQMLFEQLRLAVLPYPKIKLHRNIRRLGVYANKHKSVAHATNEWVIIFDSDNVISKEYIDKLYDVKWNSKTILAPDFAEPSFDYRKFASTTYNKLNVGRYATQPKFDALLNTMNYFINRDAYLSVYQSKPDINGADSIYFNYLWLLSGNDIHVLRGLRYFHRVHDDSYYISVAKESEPVCSSILKSIQKMR